MGSGVPHPGWGCPRPWDDGAFGAGAARKGHEREVRAPRGCGRALDGAQGASRALGSASAGRAAAGRCSRGSASRDVKVKVTSRG